MAEYSLLDAIFIFPVILVWAVRRRTSWKSLCLSLLVLVVMTAVFDNVIIATGIVGYHDHYLSGLKIGLAPIEDFGYPLGGLLLISLLKEKQ